MPWWPALWDRNYFTEAWPAIQPVLANNFVRGAITGLGLVNIAAGFADLAAIFADRSSNRDDPSEPMDTAGPPEWSGRS